jgi:hypothetical protein
MKYVYYEQSTGEIKIISPAKEVESKDPYIEVEDSDIEHIHSGKEPTFMYYVKSLSRTYPVGKIVKKEQATLNWTSINDWLYLISNEEPPVTEFCLTQDTRNKTITIKLDTRSRSYWGTNGYFKKSHFPIAACSGADPHNFVWVKIFETKDLMKDFTFEYEGTDDLRFYTHRFFDCYYHEQLT